MYSCCTVPAVVASHLGECNVRRLLLADNLALLSSNKSDLQYALDWFSDAYLGAGIKISTAKTEIMRLSRHPIQCSFQKKIRRRSLSILQSHSRVMVDRTTNWTHVMEKQVK